MGEQRAVHTVHADDPQNSRWVSGKLWSEKATLRRLHTPHLRLSRALELTSYRMDGGQVWSGLGDLRLCP